MKKLEAERKAGGIDTIEKVEMTDIFPTKTLKKPITPSRESENLNFERFTLARFVH